MEVSHIENQDTHAVVGGRGVQAFGIAQTAEFYEILSNSMYSNKPLAVVREVLCNSWDAHIASGRRNIPVKVTTTDDKLVFRDYGYGIPHDKIVEIYCVYGTSSKKHDGEQTGGFGLGSKSPFAYSHHLTVTNHHAGIKRVNALSRGSALTKGVPDFRTMVEVPTVEEGVEVSIPIKSTEDRKLFEKLVQEIASFGEMNVSLNGTLIETVKISEAENNAFITDNNNIPNSHNIINIRYGNVIYPVQPDPEIYAVYQKLERALQRIPKAHVYGENRPWRIILQAAPNSISVTPSRESLSMSETTIKTLTELFTNVVEYIDRYNPAVVESVRRMHAEAIDQLFLSGRGHTITFHENIIKEVFKQELCYSPLGTTITTLRDLCIRFADADAAQHSSKLHTEARERVQILLDSGFRRPEELKRFLRFTKHWKKGRYPNNFMHPLLKKLAKHEILNPKHMFVRLKNEVAARRGFVHAAKVRFDMQDLLNCMESTIIITYSQITYQESFRQMDQAGLFSGPARMIYVAPRAKGHREAAVEFFTRLGYYVIDFADYQEKQNALFREVSVVPQYHGPKRPPEPKKKGLILLSELNTSRDKFVYNWHTGPKASELKRSETAKYVVQGHRLSGRDRIMFFPWSDYLASDIARMFGNDIVVAVNSAQLNKHIADGKSDGFVYIAQQVCAKILASENIKEVLRHENEEDYKYHYRTSDAYDTLVKMTQYSPVIKNILNLPEPLTVEENLSLMIFRKMAEYVRTHGFYDSKAWEKVVQETRAEVLKTKSKGDKQGIIDRIKTSKRFDCLDLSDMYALLQGAYKYNPKNPDPYYPDKVFVETLIVSAFQ